MRAEIDYSLRRGRGGIFRLRVGCANTQWTSCILDLFCIDLARMNDTPQPNQKWLPVQGIEPRSLDHKPQPLPIGPFLTPSWTSMLDIIWKFKWDSVAEWLFFQLKHQSAKGQKQELFKVIKSDRKRPDLITVTYNLMLTSLHLSTYYRSLASQHNACL